MAWPVPEPGLVIRYSFLWSGEAAAGKSEGGKDRPVAIVVASSKTTEGEVRVVVAPITHSLPKDAAASLEIPEATRRELGLDDGRQWIRFDELNSFVWPGYDIRPIPGTQRIDYGFLPKDFYERMRKGILERQVARKSRALSRD
jgi:hypothetical protein